MQKRLHSSAEFGKLLNFAYQAYESIPFKEDLKSVIKLLTNLMFLNNDFTTNHFLQDNFINQNQIKSIYQSKENLLNYIKSLKVQGTDKYYFNVIHLDEVYEDHNTINFNSARKPFKDKYEEIISAMNNVQNLKQESFTNRFVLSSYQSIEDSILKKYPEMYEIFLSEGEDFLRSLGKSEMKIKQYYSIHIDDSHLKNFPLLKDLSAQFELEVKYKQGALLNSFYSILSKYNKDVKKQVNIIDPFYNYEKSKSGTNRYITLKSERFKITD